METGNEGSKQRHVHQLMTSTNTGSAVPSPIYHIKHFLASSFHNSWMKGSETTVMVLIHGKLPIASSLLLPGGSKSLLQLETRRAASSFQPFWPVWIGAAAHDCPDTGRKAFILFSPDSSATQVHTFLGITTHSFSLHPSSRAIGINALLKLNTQCITD